MVHSSYALKILNKDTDSLIKTYLATSSIRSESLFRHFLPVGYHCTTLNSVGDGLIDSVVFVKIHLGMIVTLYDDLADHPKYQNPELLSELYGLNVGRDRATPIHLDAEERQIFELARLLFFQLTEILKTFVHYDLLAPVLHFDIEQFYACNKHSELMSLLPTVRNLTESRTLGPHNMGIVAAGTLDLMASPGFIVEELGQCREIFLLGQRLGRISNLIFTLKREAAEGDLTNEILISQITARDDLYSSTLLREFDEKINEIRSCPLKTFSTSKYAAGLLALHQLHSSLEGRI